jgi:hypothetical protein
MSKRFFIVLFLLALTVFFVNPGSVEAQSKDITVKLINSQQKTAKVSINFGAYPPNMSQRRAEVKSQFQRICTNWTDEWSCNFDLTPSSKGITLPNDKKWYNMSIAFNAPGNVIRCLATQAEYNVNVSPGGDSFNISLVNGYNEPIQMTFQPDRGPILQTDVPVNAIGTMSGNERKLGVFPSGCSLCTFRDNPPRREQDPNCPDYNNDWTTGCKAGGRDRENNPDVKCQFNLDQTQNKGILTITLIDPTKVRR